MLSIICLAPAIYAETSDALLISAEPEMIRGDGGCVIANLQGGLASGFLNYTEGVGIHAILIDPTGLGGAGDPGCGTGGDFTGKLFDVEDVTFTIADSSAFGAGDGIGTLTYEVSIHPLAVSGDASMGPGTAISTFTEVLNANGSGIYSITTPFPDEDSLGEPFFVSWKLISFVSTNGGPNSASPLWDAVPRPTGRQFIDNDGSGFVDHTTFFAGGANGWVDVTVTGDFRIIPINIPTLGFYGLMLLIAGMLFVSRRKILS